MGQDGMRRTFKAYKANEKGQFGVWIAVAAFPVIMTVSLAVDFTSAEKTRSELATALDSAALAAVTNQAITEDARRAYAAEYFNENFADSKHFKLTVNNASDDRVELSAEGYEPVTVGRAAGINGLPLSESSTAILTKSDVICVLTLNPDGEDSFVVEGGSEFLAPTCSVQVNSIHESAARVEPMSKAIAKSFCTVGGFSGGFSPFVNTECSGVADPYANLLAPEPGVCISDRKLEFRLDKKVNTNQYGSLIEDEIVSVVGDNITLSPGTYCDKLKVEGYNVTFLPGTYIMNNAELEFKKGASANAKDVTFILHGKKSKVMVDSGASLWVKAPDHGPYAGLAFFQNKAAASLNEGDGKKKKKKASEFPTGKSELKGGATMSILGTVYLPAQELKVGSDSGLGTRAPATSFIAYDVAFEGGSRINVAVDHVAAGLPPLLPRSDEGARLVK